MACWVAGLTLRRPRRDTRRVASHQPAGAELDPNRWRLTAVELNRRRIGWLLTSPENSGAGAREVGIHPIWVMRLPGSDDTLVIINESHGRTMDVSEPVVRTQRDRPDPGALRNHAVGAASGSARAGGSRAQEKESQ